MEKGAISYVRAKNGPTDDIAWLSVAGITRGCTTTLPNDNVTRGQMAAFLHPFSGQTGGATDPELAAANLATAAYQDVEEAVADGYLSTLGPGEGSLGCFEDPTKGGMGVHYLKASLLDATLDPKAPEALCTSWTETAPSPSWSLTSTSFRSPPGPAPSH